MNKSRISLVLGMCIVCFAGQTAAAQKPAKAIAEALKKALPDVNPDLIKQSQIPGLFEVEAGPTLYYASPDGQYLIQGTMIDIKTMKNLTAPRVAEARINSLNKIGLDKMIIFKPKTPRHRVFVFTDIDCAYCRKLHSEIDLYMKAGIEIRYLFYPRAGIGSTSWEKAVSVWCAKDRNDALTKAKKDEAIEKKQCDNPVAEHYALGNAMHATGTPMIVTEKGNLLAGYYNAGQLFTLLEQETRK
ncbi:MAG: DsbC family protein [Gammaproteobacteria bacterium]